ncbi:MAG TPA: hypothetical protein VJB12_01375 [Candidatus Nanoarchaeia archaeon]|nr:hypothetical protein [Candidatus Nanoarchaeia archaeon]
MRTKPFATIAALIMALIAPFTFSIEDFTATSASSLSLCPCSGQGFYLTVANTGTSASAYTVSAGDSSKGFVTIPTPSFSLSPNTQTKIPIYINSPCDAKGTSSFSFIISTSNGLAKALMQQISYVPCYGFRMSAGEATSKELSGSVTVKDFNGTYSACQGDTLSIPLLVQNTDSQFDNSYTLSSDDEGMSISPSQFSLGKGKAGVIHLFHTPASLGASSATITAHTSIGDVTQSKSLSFGVKDCYEPLVEIDAKDIELCSGIRDEIAFRVINKGDFQENITLDIQGEDWASLDRTSSVLNPSRRVNRSIILNPDADLEGSYELWVKASLAKNPSITSSDSVTVTLTPLWKCFGANIELANSIRIYDDTFVPFTITNTGSKPAAFSWEIKGLDWASLDTASAYLNPKQSHHSLIRLMPNKNTSRGSHELALDVVSPHSKQSSTILVEVEEQNPLVGSLNNFFFTYRYFLYLLAALLFALFLFRGRIIRAYTEGKKRRLIRKSRLEALKKAREARTAASKKTKTSSDSSKDAPPFTGFGIGSWMMVFIAALFGLALSLYPTRVVQILSTYWGVIGIILLAGIVIAYLALRPKRRRK